MTDDVLTSFNALPPVSIPTKKTASVDPSAIERVARDFEVSFLAQMLQPMFDGFETDGLFGGGHGERMMRSFLVEGYAQKMVDSGMPIFGQALRDQLLSLQEHGHL